MNSRTFKNITALSELMSQLIIDTDILHKDSIFMINSHKITLEDLRNIVKHHFNINIALKNLNKQDNKDITDWDVTLPEINK